MKLFLLIMDSLHDQARLSIKQFIKITGVESQKRLMPLYGSYTELIGIHSSY